MSVLVILEPSEGVFRKSAYGLISYARALANMTGGNLTGLTLGAVDSQQGRETARYGVEQLIVGRDIIMEPFSASSVGKRLSEEARKEKANILVFGSGFTARALAPVVAASLEASLATGVYNLPESIDPFEIKKKVFSGKAIATMRLKSQVKVLTLQANAFEMREKPAASFRESPLQDSPGEEHKPIELLSKENKAGSIRLTEAEVVVSGGRGMGGPENWAPLEELATLLGAATACSRPVSDQGWRPHTEHVGQTGKIIAPNLYIALGISGAIQHLAGVRGSKVIVAINKDPEAILFQAADYGVVGDAGEILPRLIEAVKKARE